MEYKNLFKVKGKNVLITGSSRGLGFNFAKGFVQAGANVIINGRNEKRVMKAVKELNQFQGKAHGYPFNVAKKEQVDKNIKLIEKEIGPVDVLINNAGIQKRAPLENLSLENWKKVIEVNLNAVFIVSQVVARNMITRNKGKIINITSLNAEGARPTIGNYCAAKGGLKMLTKSMAAEWGEYNIQVNAIGPGYFKTDMTRKLVENPEFDKWVKQEVPLKRWGNPEELIGAAIFLASDASSYVNGHTLYVDGGWQASL
ncbi:MAG: SDR family oxidoreductase [Bacillota bacterium]